MVLLLYHPYLVITIMGLTTDVSENNSTVQACVNITRGSVESSDNSVFAYISTSPSTGINSAIGMISSTVQPLRHHVGQLNLKSPDIFHFRG